MGQAAIINPVPNPKPFVQVACICEKVLREQDNVPSIIRIVEVFTFDAPPKLPPGISAAVALPLTIFVALVAGDVVGEHTLSINLTRPNGTSTRVSDLPVVFVGGGGVNLQIGFNLQSPEEGQYWFDVLWVDEVLTRIPVRFRIKSATQAVAATESESK